MDSTVKQKRRNLKEVRSARSADMTRQSAGGRAQVWGLMLVTESDSSFANKNAPTKLVHDLLTGPSSVQQLAIQGFAFDFRMHGRMIRERTASAPKVKKLHVRPEQLRYSFPGKYSQLTWGTDLGLATDTPSVIVVLRRTGKRCPVRDRHGYGSIGGCTMMKRSQTGYPNRRLQKVSPGDD